MQLRLDAWGRPVMTQGPGSADPAWCLRGSGAAAALARATEWSRTPLGAVSGWPASLRTIVATLLNARQPMMVWWGPDLIQLYNDALIPILGRGRHPAAMGQPAAECWPEAWPVLEPQVGAVLQRGQPSWNEDQLMQIRRDGRLEAAYWTYGCSPLFDDDGHIGGVLLTASESTARVWTGQWQQMTRLLTDRTNAASSTQAVIAQVFQLAAEAPAEIPFLLLYGARSDGPGLTLQYYSRIDSRALKSLDAILRPVLQESSVGDRHSIPGSRVQCRSQRIALASRGISGVAGASEALVVSRLQPERHDRLVFGLNPDIPLESGYAAFLLQVASIVYAAHDRAAAIRQQYLITQERDNLLLQAPIATAVLEGPLHTFSLVNRRYLELAGREVIGRAYRDAFPEHSDIPALLDHVQASGVGSTLAELWLPLQHHAASTTRQVCVQLDVEPMRSIAGGIYALMVVVVDITAQVQGRQALERANAEREQLVRELREASRTKDEFMAILGHELRNPLAPIVATLDVMRLRAGGVESREVAVIRRQAEHMVHLVDDLLDVGRIVAGKVELKDERVDVPEVLAEAVRMAGPLMEQRGHAFEMRLESDDLVCRGDTVRLAQCVSNLLTNAARYTPGGGKIVLRAALSDGEVVIRVSDNGKGIAPEALPQIFELFNQEDREQGGLGIGLALVRDLMRLHGGSVSATSAGPGKGSEFTLHLPAGGRDAPEPVRQAMFQPSGPGALSASRQVLVVDDNDDAAESLAELLRLDGHEVQVALEPASALAMFDQFHPEIVILDIGLPGMNGYELAARMREHHPHCGARFIALTGYGAPVDVERSTAAGFEAHLVKPVDMVRLARLVSAGDAD